VARLKLSDIPGAVGKYEALAVWAVEQLAIKAQGKRAGLTVPGEQAPVATVDVIEAADGRWFARLEAFPPIDLGTFNSPAVKTWQAAGALVGENPDPAEVQAPPPPPPPPAPTPLTTFAYSQSSVYSGNTAATRANMQDKNQNTGTGTNNAFGEFIRFDMGGVYEVDRIHVSAPGPSMPGGWGGGYIGGANWRLEVSTDAVTWDVVASDTVFSTSQQRVFNVSVSCRYVRHRYLQQANKYLACSEFYALAPGQTF